MNKKLLKYKTERMWIEENKDIQIKIYNLKLKERKEQDVSSIK